MKRNSKRGWLAAAAAVVAGVAASTSQAKADFPERPVTFVVGASAGGPTDINVRILADALTRTTGTRFLVENKPGAGGAIAAEFVRNARPDGYTLLYAFSGSMTAVPAMNEEITYDAGRDYETISYVAELGPMFLLTNPQTGVTDFKGVVEQAKQAPGKYNVSTVGPGVLNSVVASYLIKVAGVEIEDVPYPGTGPAVIALAEGHVDFAVANLQTFKPFAEDGKILPLAVIANERTDTSPDVPTIAEAGYPQMMETSAWAAWQAVMAPKGVPQDIVNRLNVLIAEALQDPPLVEQFNAFELTLFPDATPEWAHERISVDAAAWSKLVDELELR